MLRIASFDIGKVNFAFFVEDCELETINTLRQKYKKLPKQKQRKVKGIMNDQVESILNTLYKTSSRVDMGVFDIREDKTSKELDLETRLNMYSLLDRYGDLWDSCHIILIEQQYFNISQGKKFKKTKGSGANVDAIKLAECCMSWFLIRYAKFKKILYFGSLFKTHTLGAPEGLTKSQRKKWSIEKTKEILELRNDTETIELMKGFKNAKGKKQKLDDVSDCVIMTQAYKYLKLVAEI